MLILIAGITGNIGQHAARHALSLGHRVRGLSRTPTKLDSSIYAELESFVPSTSWYDVGALDKACAGVEAIICAYAGTPELHLEGQLLLLRTAERAGVRRFLAASHNNDWRKIKMGDVPIYDPIRMFHIQAALSSSIKPLHIFSGTFLDVLFGGEGQGDFTPDVGGIWDPTKKEMHYWGTGDEEWCFTTEEDGGKWAVELVTSPNAHIGGYVSICSMKLSLLQLKDIYQKLQQRPIKLVSKGSIDELEKLIESKKTEGRPWIDWFRNAFVAYCVRGTWMIEEELLEGFGPSQPTKLEEWLRRHPNT